MRRCWATSRSGTSVLDGTTPPLGDSNMERDLWPLKGLRGLGGWEVGWWQVISWSPQLLVVIFVCSYWACLSWVCFFLCQWWVGRSVYNVLFTIDSIPVIDWFYLSLDHEDKSTKPADPYQVDPAYNHTGCWALGTSLPKFQLEFNLGLPLG